MRCELLGRCSAPLCSCRCMRTLSLSVRVIISNSAVSVAVRRDGSELVSGSHTRKRSDESRYYYVTQQSARTTENKASRHAAHLNLSKSNLTTRRSSSRLHCGLSYMATYSRTSTPLETTSRAADYGAHKRTLYTRLPSRSALSSLLSPPRILASRVQAACMRTADA